MNREDFPMLKQDIIYFDNGATTFKPISVINKMTEYYVKYCANAHRGDYDISFKVDQEYELTRDKVKEFINAKNRSEIIFTSGATDSLNLVASGFFANNIETGDEILITKSEHASNVLPWFRIAKNNGAVIKYIELDANHHVTLENVVAAISPKTKLIALAHITNVIGDIRPIKEICRIAHQNNIFVVVDGAQSVAHMPVDMQDLDCDFFCFSAHKMCGPTGVGVLYGKKELLEAVEPVNMGGGMNESFDNENEVLLKSLPTRLEAGTPNIAGVIGLGAAIDYLEEMTMDKIYAYEQKLRDYLVDKLSKISHVDIINLNSKSGIVTFNIDGIFSQDVAFYLNQYNICVRAGSHCAKILKNETGVKNTLRVSLYFYNTHEEVDKLVELLSDKNKILAEMF